jgi:hypothetical protein
MSNYEKLMNTDLGAMEEPKDVIPSGEWVLRCQAARENENENYDEDDPKNDALSIVKFTHVPVEPFSNVDMDAVGDGTWRGVPLFTTRYIKTDRDLYQVREVVAAHGISIEGRTLNDAVELMKGKQVLATIGLKTYKRRGDGETVKTNTLTNFRVVE